MDFLFLTDRQKTDFSVDEVAKIKQYLLDTPLLKDYDRLKLRSYLISQNDNTYDRAVIYLQTGKRLKQFNIYQYKLQSLKNRFNSKVFQVADNLLSSRYHKVSNIKSRLTDYILTGRAYFLTLTFRDDVLESTSEVTRRRYVSRYLKQMSSNYVANIDFGEDFGREHYHAIIIDYNESILWSYGFMKAMKVGTNESSPVKLSKYITKLTFHAVKESTRYGLTFRRLIYSRLN